MKILIVNTLYAPNQVGGAEKSVQLLAEELHRQNHSVMVVCLDKESNKRNINGVDIIYLENKNIYWPFDDIKVSKIKKMIWHFLDTYSFYYSSKLKDILSSIDPDVVHVNNISGFSTNILGFIKKQCSKPIVYTARDYYLLCHKTTFYKNNSRCETQCADCKFLSKKKINNVNNNVSVFVGISNYILKKHINTGLRQDLINSVIFNSVDNTSISHKTKKTSKTNVFGFMGTISKAKGIEVLLEDFTSSKINSFQFKLKIAGKGNNQYISFLKKKYQNKKIEYLGFVNPSQFYQQIDALIVPSQWEEPFGRVVIEASRYGLPIFVSENGGLTELKEIIHSVFAYNIENIISFINNKEKSIDIEPQSLNEFSNTIITEQYLKLYKSISESDKIR
ncbi:glycosyltransferase [Psychroserpens sp. MEBiC05023]